MGLYIQGIEMPKNEEMLCVNIYPDGKVCISIDVDGKDYISLDLDNEKIATAIPLLPHGRLIDADGLNYTMLYKEDWLSGTGVEAPAVWKKDIDDAPTIIEAEEGE